MQDTIEDTVVADETTSSPAWAALMAQFHMPEAYTSLQQSAVSNVNTQCTLQTHEIEK